MNIAEIPDIAGGSLGLPCTPVMQKHKPTTTTTVVWCIGGSFPQVTNNPTGWSGINLLFNKLFLMDESSPVTIGTEHSYHGCQSHDSSGATSPPKLPGRLARDWPVPAHASIRARQGQCYSPERRRISPRVEIHQRESQLFVGCKSERLIMGDNDWWEMTSKIWD